MIHTRTRKYYLYMDFVTILVLLLSSVTLIIYQQWRKKSAKLPPGPFPLPIIGSIFQLGDLPHRSLEKLSKIYGPLMHLKLGSKQAIVVSSPEMAKEVLLKNDQTCSGRAVPFVVQMQNHHEASIAWLSGGTKWRKFRKICKENMFITQKLEASEALRQEKLGHLRSYLGRCCADGRVVDISEVVFVTVLNLTSTTLFSLDFAHFESDSAQEMKEIITSLTSVAGTPNLVDYFPVLKYIDPQGINRKAKFYGEKLLELLDKIIFERLQYRSTSSATKKSDLLEVLLDLMNQENDANLSYHDLKHLFFDLIIGGADTTADTMVWAMTELLRNPSKMSKVKEELDSVIGENERVEEHDIPRLPYLHAVLKETFRYHPATPFLIPHTASATVEINGYSVPKDSTILVNIFSIGRDETIWTKPELFNPERFLDNKLDYRGKDFELLPFGSGRRMCPGLPLAHIMLHAMLASMIHKFDWKLEPGVKPEDIDVNEKFGLLLHRASHLKAFPVKL